MPVGTTCGWAPTIFLGGWRGDQGLGLAARVGYRRQDAGSFGYAILSIELRLPAMAGLPVPAPRPRS